MMIVKTNYIIFGTTYSKSTFVLARYLSFNRVLNFTSRPRECAFSFSPDKTRINYCANENVLPWNRITRWRRRRAAIPLESFERKRFEQNVTIGQTLRGRIEHGFSSWAAVHCLHWTTARRRVADKPNNLKTLLHKTPAA